MKNKFKVLLLAIIFVVMIKTYADLSLLTNQIDLEREHTEELKQRVERLKFNLNELEYKLTVEVSDLLNDH